MGINTSAATREVSTVILWRPRQKLTDVAPQVPLLHMSDAVYLVQNLQTLRWTDRSTHILASFSQLFGRDIMALS